MAEIDTKKLDYLTPKEAAEIYRVDIDTVRELIRTGKLRAAKFGPNTTRIATKDLEECFARLADESLKAMAPAGTSKEEPG